MGETLLGSRSQRGVLGAFHRLVGAELALDGLHGDPVRLLHLQLLQRGGGWTVGYAALAVGGELNLGEGAPSPPCSTAM